MQTVFRRKFGFDVDCENWGLFFKTLITNLKPGRFGNQTFQFQTKKNLFKFVNVSTKQLIDNNAKQIVNIWRRKEEVFDWVRLVFILIHFHFFTILFLYDVFWSRFREWGWTAQNLIARQSFARHFWQEINWSTQNLSTARIQLILAHLDSSSWQKKWPSSWHFLVRHINWKNQFFTYRNGQ